MAAASAAPSVQSRVNLPLLLAGGALIGGALLLSQQGEVESGGGSGDSSGNQLATESYPFVFPTENPTINFPSASNDGGYSSLGLWPLFSNAEDYATEYPTSKKEESLVDDFFVDETPPGYNSQAPAMSDSQAGGLLNALGAFAGILSPVNPFLAAYTLAQVGSMNTQGENWQQQEQAYTGVAPSDVITKKDAQLAPDVYGDYVGMTPREVFLKTGNIPLIEESGVSKKERELANSQVYEFGALDYTEPVSWSSVPFANYWGESAAVLQYTQDVDRSMKKGDWVVVDNRQLVAGYDRDTEAAITNRAALEANYADTGTAFSKKTITMYEDRTKLGGREGAAAQAWIDRFYVTSKESTESKKAAAAATSGGSNSGSSGGSYQYSAGRITARNSYAIGGSNYSAHSAVRGKL